MLLQERLLPNNVNVRLVLSHSRPAFYLMDFDGKSAYHVHIEEALLEVHKVNVAAFEQLHLDNVLRTSGAKYQLAHVVTRRFTLAAGASTADMDALLTRQIPTKIFIGLVNNEAFYGSWSKSPFNFAHMDLNQACLVVDGWPLLAQPWQTDCAGPVCRDLPRHAKVRQDVPQWLEQWLVCQTVRGWQHALVLGPDAQRQ